MGGAAFVTSVFFSAHKTPPEKGSTLKGKNFHLMGANSFLLE